MDDSTKLMKFIMMLAIKLANLIFAATKIILCQSMYMSTGRQCYVEHFNAHSDHAKEIMDEFEELNKEMA